MIRTRLIPVLLLKDRGLVKTTNFKSPSYVGDPRNALKIFNEKEVDELCFLDISAGRESSRPNFELLEEIVSEGFMPIAYGGGIRSLDDIHRLFKIGIEKVVLNSIIFQTPSLIFEAAQIYGEQSIVLSFDLKHNKGWFGVNKGYSIYTNSGKKKITGDYLQIIKELVALGAGEVLVNSIDKDGTREGLDIELLDSISKILDVPVIGCGGVGSLNHIKEAVDKTRLSAIAAGSFFVYHGKHRAVLITYPSIDSLNQIF